MNSEFSKAKKRKLHKINNNSKSLTTIYYTNESNNKSLSMNYTNFISSYQNNSSLQKNNKKKIFKSIYTGFTETTFGSIPYKTENFLLNKNINNPGFNDVKSIFYSDKLGNPGVGKYNLSKDFVLTRWDMKLGGYDTRFKTSFNLMPGTEDYSPEENKIF